MNLYQFHTNPKDIHGHDTMHEKKPEWILDNYKNKPKELKRREPELAKSPDAAYKYACNVLQGPFPAGEVAIAKDACYAWYYALEVLKKPFPAGEAAIAKNTGYAYHYALEVLKLPELEAKAWGK